MSLLGSNSMTWFTSMKCKDIPAFVDDEYITSRNDYITKIDFQLSKIHTRAGTRDVISSWDQLISDLLKHQKFGKFIKKAKSHFAKTHLAMLNLEGKSENEKAKTITNKVKELYSLNDFYGKYANQTISEMQKTKRGNVGNINLYLVGALRAAGMNVDPVILSTRTHGKVNRDYPITEKFNYVIATVSLGDNMLLIDATSSETPYFMLPLRCLNDWLN